MRINPDLLNDGFSSTMCIETILAHDLVPEGFPASSKGPTGTAILRRVKYLVVDQTSNGRQGSESCECERAFNIVKELTASERNSLDDNIIEALECLRG
jgi:hypothetical protein